jgi:predicted acyl esterase
MHRKISTDQPPYTVQVPYHSLKRKDALPVVPGQVIEMTFGLWPTSVLLKKNHRIRVAIAGADRDTFARLPAEGTPTIAVERNARRCSFIELPVFDRP